MKADLVEPTIFSEFIIKRPLIQVLLQYLATGVDYLYANIDDGLNQTTHYATGPIKVTPEVAPNPDILLKDGFEG